MRVVTILGAAAYAVLLTWGPDYQDREQRIHEALLVTLIVGAILGGKEK